MENSPVNIVYLIVVALALFVMGYRFYAKFLGIAVFPSSQYSPGARSAGDKPVIPLSISFGHHMASLVAGTSLIGSAAALLWGWVPAFLWLLAGTVVGAGTYGMASFWISNQFPGKNLSEIVGHTWGRGLSLVFSLTTLILLFLLSGASLWLVARMLQMHNELVLLFWLQLPLACLLGRFWQQNRFQHLFITGITYLGLVLVAVTVLGHWSVGFSGTLNLDILDKSRLSVDAQVVWIVLLLLSVWFVQKRDINQVARPRAWMVSIQLALLVGLVLLALLIEHPNIQAPQFHQSEQGPGVWPWLFLVITSGALAGFHGLVANGISADAVSNSGRSARLLGYGGALVDGTLALVILFVLVTQFDKQEAWEISYANWDLVRQPENLVNLIAVGFAKNLGILGFSEQFARTFSLVTILGVLITTVDACATLIRAQLRFLGNSFSLVPFKAKRTRGLGVSLISILFVMFASQHKDILTGGSMYGLLGSVVGLFISMSVIYWLLKKRQWLYPVAIIGFWFLIVTVSAWITSWSSWWQGNQLLTLAPLLLVAIMLIGLIFLSARRWLSYKAANNLTPQTKVPESD